MQPARVFTILTGAGAAASIKSSGLEARNRDSYVQTWLSNSAATMQNFSH